MRLFNERSVQARIVNYALPVGLLSILLAACARPAPPQAPPCATPPAPPARHRAEVTLLYTSDEHGWLVPFVEDGKSWGGAAEMLAKWVHDEGHCPGALPAGAATVGAPTCADPATLALSGGDNYTGPAISTYFGGTPLADAFARMGYAAAALGNHELDFGRDAFLRNRQRAGIEYLSANVRVVDNALAGSLAMPAFRIFERRGMKIAVVGLTTDTTLTVARASRYDGLAIDPEEEALNRAVQDAWKADPDAVVVIAHECVDRLSPIVAKHPEWHLSFVGAGHCHKVVRERAGDVSIVSPGWRFMHYARVKLTLDPTAPAQHRVTAGEPEVIDVTRAPGTPSEVDVPLSRAANGWQRSLDEALGAPIGYTRTGITRGSPTMVQWIGGAWRDQLHVDISILNKGAFRQDLPPGPITQASILSVLPFDNAIITGTLTGAGVRATLANPDARWVGLLPSPGGGSVESATPVDDATAYKFATIDFIYEGGAGFNIRKLATTANDTAIGWREPVVEWTRNLKTTAEDPLEKHIR